MGRGQSKKQRLMRKDFAGGGGKRDSKWSEQRNAKAQHFLEAKDLKNEAFDEYYKTQDIVPAGEWEDFVDCLRRPLPITFRINGSGKFANELREKMETDFFKQFKQGPITIDGELVHPPRPLPWYPSNLGWHMNFSRNQLRKLSWLGDIHQWMKGANEAGSITRQEAVSMVPPMLMDVQPHHRVLDMCAAPGSKTFQLLEMLHDMDIASKGSGSGSTPGGFVVANDADAQRCNLLTHQTKRMCSPCLMITNHYGEQFPAISSAALDSAAAAVAAAAGGAGGSSDQAAAAAAAVAAAAAQGSNKSGDIMLFDRILCDVPCSGDGTMRKAPDIWRRWSVVNGNGLHCMQLKIALQAVRLLKVGGRMVYSTCTFNPIEDEAVVAELLLRCGGALQLVDVSQQLPELIRCPGKRQWRVRDKYQWYDTWEQAQKIGFKLDPSMFSTPEKQQLPLERCMRILPHHQDTGGFFVAVLEKVAATPNLQDPTTSHRFSRIIPAGRDGRLIKADGLDPHQGAADAAAYAIEAASKAIAALEALDAPAATAAQNAAGAAVARANMAYEAASETYKLQRRYEAQEAAKKAKQQARQDATAAAANGAAAEGEASPSDDEADAELEAEAAAVEDMEGVEAAADAEAEDVAAAAAEEMAEDEEAEAAGPGPGSEGAAAGAEDGAAAAADRSSWQPSWVRGGGNRNRAGGGGRWRGIDPIIPVEDPNILNMLVSFYGVEAGFPLTTHLITRSLEAVYPKRIYYVSDSLLGLLLADKDEKLKITSTGLKIFERHELRGKESGKCQYRIAQEGLPFLLPHLTKQVVRLGVDDFIRLLTEKNLPLLVSAVADKSSSSASEQQHLPAEPVKTPSKQQPLSTPAVLKQLDLVESGGAVAVLEEEAARKLGLATADDQTNGALAANAPLAISVWKTRASLSVLVAKAECEQLVEKIRGAVRRQQQEQQAQPQDGQPEAAVNPAAAAEHAVA